MPSPVIALKRTIASVEVIPWREHKGQWGIVVRYVGGMETAEKIGTRAEAEAVAEASRP